MKISDMIAGLQIIAKHTKGEYCVQAEHDQLYAGDDTAYPPEDEAKLIELGWFRDDNGGWSAFT